jgi:hypothetical protein
MEGELWPPAEVHKVPPLVQVRTFFLKVFYYLLYFFTLLLNISTNMGGGGAGHRERDAHQVPRLVRVCATAV